MGDEDELLEEAKEIIVAAGKASTSLLQRRLRIGYSRAASILDMLEETGIVGPSNGSKPREILISKEQYENQLNNSMAGIPVHDKKEAKAPDNYLYQEDESPLVLETEDEEEDLGAEGNNLEENNDNSSLENEEADLDDDFGKYSSK